MGMDLIPTRGDDGFHANWASWRYISALLCQLAIEGKVDVSRLRGSNDGDYINAKTARAWGKAVLDALERNRIRNIKFEDRFGLREEPILFDLSEPTKQEIVQQEIAESIVIFSLEFPNYRGLGDLSNADKEWLKKFANFCIDSRGFRQC